MNVGDYVRFKDKRENTYIRKVVDLPQDIRYGAIKIDIEANYSNMLSPKNIIKSSPNIIDLIEVGDYVNGYYVNEITDIDTGLPVLCNFDLNTMRWTPLENIDIWYSILTKEQFESMEYKIGE